MQEITPPASISDSTITLAADANWLVCEKICIPGNATLQVALPVSSEGAPANAELFARFRRLLPQDMPGSETVSTNWHRAGAALFFTVTSETLAKYPVADFFPLPEGEIVVGHPKVESRSGSEVIFRIPIEAGDPPSINGLVVFGI
jgi:thiol:disulfide interchange protein DsbD